MDRGLLACCLLVMPLGGCGPVESTPIGGTVAGTHGRAWTSADAPARLQEDMEDRLDQLPLHGEVDRVPWPASYWPTHADSINARWDGADSLSPAEKFELAFNRPGFADRVSAIYGIDSQHGQRSCFMNMQCDRGQVCAIRRDERSGYCVDTWFGLCHAWAPAAVLEDEPRRAVTHNGVEFKVNDIKALVTLAYTRGVDGEFMSLRCDDPGRTIHRDPYGNPTSDACIDTNPGAFHVAVANLVGFERRSFIEDRTWDAEVWNQPVRAYDVRALHQITESEANRYLASHADEYAFNAAAYALHYVEMSLFWIAESAPNTDGYLGPYVDTYTGRDDYRYILETDSDGRILGGEWVGESKTNHPDFLWLPAGRPRLPVAGSTPTRGMYWSDVQQLLDASTR